MKATDFKTIIFNIIGMVSVFLIAVFLFSIWTGPNIAAAQVEQPQSSFEIQAIELNNDELLVTVLGENLNDAYAFEIQLQFDPLRLQFQGAQSDNAGFTMQPIVNGKQLVFAHTKIGNVAGISGEAKLAELKFKRIRGGNAELSLNTVQIVNSKLERDSIAVTENYVAVDDGEQVQLNDLTNHWSEEKIRTAVELGFVSGYSDATFRPDQPITRAEFSVILARALQLSAARELSFSDEQSIPSWARGGVAATVKAGLVKGYTDGTFRGEQHINRAELAVMIARTLDSTDQAETPLNFVDHVQIPQWAQSSIQLGLERGLLQGRGGNRFMPLAQATRAEAVSLVLKLLHYKVGLDLQ